MGDLPPEWAWKRMRDLTADEAATNAREVAFARYIAANEEVPVDPLLIAKRQALGEWADLTWGKGSSFAADYRAGKNDDDSNARLAEIALRRGIEIAGGVNG